MSAENEKMQAQIEVLSQQCESLRSQVQALHQSVHHANRGMEIIFALQELAGNGQAFEETLELLTAHIQEHLRMSLTCILLADEEERHRFRASHIKSTRILNVEDLMLEKIAIEPTDFDHQLALIFSKGGPETPSIGRIRSVLPADTFILAPIRQQKEIIGYIYAGHLDPIEHSPLQSLDQQAHTLSALAGVIATFKYQVDQNIFLETLVTQRTQQLTHEKEKTERLLLNILPSEITEELKALGTVRAKAYASVTVLFTDFINFTRLSQILPAQELVNEIHFFYSAFDRIISENGLEKIKTIGDSYMCAGGLPAENSSHAFDAVNAAIAIRDLMLAENEVRRTENRPTFEIRIGCNTGPVIAGVVGIQKFAYDIWGDTVNIASRIEAAAMPNSVNISGSTYALVSDQFDCTHRGRIPVKNHGEVEMFVVN
jgi:class 3 adenylate cyclase